MRIPNTWGPIPEEHRIYHRLKCQEDFGCFNEGSIQGAWGILIHGRLGTIAVVVIIGRLA